MVIFQLKYKISNKKAGAPIDEITAFVVFVILATLVIIATIIINKYSENKINTDISNDKLLAEADSNIISFLRQLDKDVTTSNLILRSYYSKDFTRIPSSARNFFNSRYSNEWVLVLEDSGGNLIFSVDSSEFQPGRMVITDFNVRTISEVASANLPLDSSTKLNYLKIRLLLRMPKDGVATE